MSDRTIPKATNDEFSVALTGIMSTAEGFGVDTLNADNSAFLIHQAEVKAQMMAENRGLHNIIQRMTK